MRFPLVGSSYRSRSTVADCERTMNLYPETVESGQGASQTVLYGTPGLHTWSTLAASPVTGLFYAEPYLYAVAAGKLYRLDSTGTATYLGDCGNPTGTASFAWNGTELLVTTGGTAFIWNGTTFTSQGFTSARVGFSDNYFISLRPNSRVFQIRDYSSTVWNALDVAVVEGQAENVLAFIADHRELWFFGSRHTEVYYNSVDPSFPFNRIEGGYIEQGIIAAESVVKLDNSLFWLGGSQRGGGIVWRAQGYTPARVSTHAMEYALSQYAFLDDCISWTYEDGGHAFMVMYFPRAYVMPSSLAGPTVYRGATWVYDAATGQWHERGYWDDTHGFYQAHRGRCHAYAFGKHLVGDWENGKIYEMNQTFRDDFGDELRWERISPVIQSEHKTLFFNELVVLAETGVGLTTGQGSLPEMFLSWSDDSGRTWSNERSIAMGAIGDYQVRARTLRLGRSRARAFKIAGSDPVPIAIVDGYVEVEAGNS